MAFDGFSRKSDGGRRCFAIFQLSLVIKVDERHTSFRWRYRTYCTFAWCDFNTRSTSIAEEIRLILHSKGKTMQELSFMRFQVALGAYTNLNNEEECHNITHVRLRRAH